MRQKPGFRLVVLLVWAAAAAWAAVAVHQAAAAQWRPADVIVWHPEIRSLTSTEVYDYEMRAFVTLVDVELRLAGPGRGVAATAVWSGVYPYTAAEWDLALTTAQGTYDARQWQRLREYTTAVLSCDWDAPAAHVYDGEPRSWNGRGLALETYAERLGAALRVDCGGRYPPPRG